MDSIEFVKGVIGGTLLGFLFILAFMFAEHREENRQELQKQSWIEQGFPIGEQIVVANQIHKGSCQIRQLPFFEKIHCVAT